MTLINLVHLTSQIYEVILPGGKPLHLPFDTFTYMLGEGEKVSQGGGGGGRGREV